MAPLQPSRQTPMGQPTAVASPDHAERRARATSGRARFTAIVAQPGFEAVVVVHDRMFAARFLPNPALDTAFREAWRFQIVAVAIYLHDTRTPDDPRSGLTIGRLQATLAGRSLASAGRIASILKQLEAAGHLASIPSTADRRIVLLTPTPSLGAAIRLWEAAIFALIGMTDSTDDLETKWRNMPLLGAQMRQHMVSARLAGWSPLDGFPDIAMFATRDGGWRLLSRIAAMRMSGEHGDHTAPMEIDLQAFARETGTSRSSLRRLLEDAYVAGLFEGPPRNGRNLLPAPALIASFSAWLAMFIDAHRQFALAALKDLNGRYD